jgi:predicted RNA-binding protein YlxR (DUF448 family)
VSSQRANQVTDNRHRLKPIVETLIFLGRQNIPLRGHRDDGSLLDISESSVNEGNFRELLRFRVGAGDKVLENHLQTASSRATYISKRSQNSLLECCGKEILSRILQMVNESKFFSILFDETTDVSHTSQMSLIVRYIHEGCIREDFIGFVDPHGEVYTDPGLPDDNTLTPEVLKAPVSVLNIENNLVETLSTVATADIGLCDNIPEPKLNGQVLGKLVVEIMQRVGLSLDKCVGIGTDGCSVMASQICGAVKTIQSFVPQALRSPCFNHALNLSLGKSSSVQSIRNAVGTVKEVVSFFNASAKRNFIFKRVAGSQLQSLCETRWVERHDSLLQFCSGLHDIVRALTIISKWDDRDSSSKANILVHALSSSEFIVSLFALCDVLSVTLPISKKLQTVKIDCMEAKATVDDVISVLTTRRDDFDHFDQVYGYACDSMTDLEVPVVMPRLTSRQKNRANPPADSAAEYYRRAVYFPLVDSVLADLNYRFVENATLDKLNDLTYFVPACVVLNESLINISSLLKRYSFADAADEVKLRGELALWRQRWIRLKTESNVVVPETAADALEACDRMTFPFIHTFLCILVTLPVSTASAERSFSTLRRLKTWLRSRMTEERLTGLALMNIHRDIPVDVDKVIDRFAKSNRRLDFIL